MTMVVRNLDGPAVKKLGCQDKFLICLNQRTISCHNAHKPPRAILPRELWRSKQRAAEGNIRLEDAMAKVCFLQYRALC